MEKASWIPASPDWLQYDHLFHVPAMMGYFFRLLPIINTPIFVFLKLGIFDPAMCKLTRCTSQWRRDALVRLPVSVMKHDDQKAIWEGKCVFGLHFPVTHCSSLKEVRKGTETWQEPGSGSWCSGCGLLIMVCTVCFFIEPRTANPGMVPLRVDWALKLQSLTKKMLYPLNLWRQFFSWGSLPSDNSI